MAATAAAAPVISAAEEPADEETEEIEHATFSGRTEDGTPAQPKKVMAFFPLARVMSPGRSAMLYGL